MLQRVEIGNFRSIKNQRIFFDHRMTTLVGINESGKSNILKALSLISPDVPLSLDDVRDPGHDEEPSAGSYVHFVFSLEEHMLEEVASILDERIPLWETTHWIVEKDNIKYTPQQFLETQRNQFVYVANLAIQKKYLTNWSIDAKKYQGSGYWKRVRKGASVDFEVRGEIETFAEGDILNPDLVHMVTSEALEEIDVAEFISIVDKAVTDVAKGYLPTCIHWKYSEDNLLPERIPKDAFSQNPKSCVPLRNMFLLAGYRDITKTITEAEGKKNGITNILRKISENTTAHMRSVWPEWEDIKVVVSENGDYFEAGIEDKYNIYSASRRSDGFKRFFTFLLLISAQNKSNLIVNNIVIIDEPEIGLHPTGVRFLRQELESISKNNLVVVATHSIFMVDSNIIDRHLIIVKENEVTKVSRVESSNITDEEVIFKALGYTLYDMLRPVNIIFEGWKDKAAFRKYLEGPRGSKIFNTDRIGRVGLLHAFGVKDVERVAGICETFDRKYVIITDSDAPAKERQKAFRGRGEWICYDQIDGVDAATTEDFFDVKVINASISKILDRENFSAQVKLTSTQKNMKIKSISDLLSSKLDPDADKVRLVRLIKEDLSDDLLPGSFLPSYGKVVQALSDRVKKL